MKVKQLKHDGLSYELEVIVSANDIDSKIDSKLKEVGKTIRMPGFRPGKVPLQILKQRYGKAVLGEVLEAAVNDTSAKALEDKGLRPAMQPKIEVQEFDEGKDLKYKMEVEVFPDFELTDAKKIKLEKPVADVDKKAIDEALEKIAEQNQDTEDVKEKRAAKKGDIVEIDFDGRKADGESVPGMSGEGHQLELGS